MQQLSERKGFKIESTLPQKKKKKKETKAKPVEHVRIIDDDVLIPYAATQQPLVIVNDEIVSIEDDPVVVGKNPSTASVRFTAMLMFRYCRRPTGGSTREGTLQRYETLARRWL